MENPALLRRLNLQSKLSSHARSVVHNLLTLAGDLPDDTVVAVRHTYPSNAESFLARYYIEEITNGTPVSVECSASKRNDVGIPVIYFYSRGD